MARPWSGADRGRPEDRWLQDVPWGELPVADLAALAEEVDRVVVLAAHPDDETLGCGATLADLAARGAAVDVVLATDGEASHPRSSPLPRDALAAVRRHELATALDRLGVDTAPTWWGIDDGGIPAARAVAAARLDALLQEHADDRLVLVAPWTRDGHSDHDALGEVAREVASRHGVPVVGWLVWHWHWAEPHDLPAGDLVLTCPSADALHRRAHALEAFPSQTTTVGLAGEAPPVLTAASLTRARRVAETLVDPDGVLPRRGAPASAPAADFDAMFAHGEDPWGVEEKWYEHRRQAIVEAMLPHRHLGRVLDLGCSTGRLTAALDARADQVVAVDHSAAALDIARRRPTSGVEWRQGALPEALDEVEGPFDVVVLSEVAYFLDGQALLTVLAAARRLLSPGGVVVTAGWQHPTRDIPLDGVLVDQQVAALWPTLSRYADDDVVITVSSPDGEAAR